MNLQLHKSQLLTKKHIAISGSKSESNRLLLLQILLPGLSVENLSNSDDTQLMIQALSEKKEVIDVHHAGTAMRFLTSFFAIQNGKETILTGSKRMKQRPIKILVDALQSLGANIQYTEKEGFPPLKIKGKTLTKKEVSINAQVSSQYISSLLLIGAFLKNGLKINLLGNCTSLPYLIMTIELLKQIGIEVSFSENSIEIKPIQNIKNQTIIIESDWSSASYFYSFIALSNIGTEILLSSFKEKSLQGDKILSEIYKNFGVTTSFSENKIILKKTSAPFISHLNYNLINAPDIAQTLAVTCFGLKISCHLQGLHTLKIKETDRLNALKIELTKLGAFVEISEEHIQVTPIQLIENVSINTYNDHRMAMAFAPLSLKTSLTINHSEVVSKSYPNFWNDLKKLGIKQNEI